MGVESESFERVSHAARVSPRRLCPPTFLTAILYGALVMFVLLRGLGKSHLSLFNIQQARKAKRGGRRLKILQHKLKVQHESAQATSGMFWLLGGAALGTAFHVRDVFIKSAANHVSAD